MPLQRLHLKNFRLFQDKTFTFSDGINLILGENGSGKTTVLEALNVLLTGNSFRAKETKECIQSDKEFYNLSAKGDIRGKNLTLFVQNSHNKRLFSKRMVGLSFLRIIKSPHIDIPVQFAISADRNKSFKILSSFSSPCFPFSVEFFCLSKCINNINISIF